MDFAGHYPVFSWEEEDYSQMIVGTGPSAEPRQVYNHSSTQIPGLLGLLVDTGAFWDLSGGDAVEAAGKLSAAHGFPVQWDKLPKPKYVSGVGDKANVCTHQARVPGILEDGTALMYTTPVISGNPSPVPSLLGRRTMAKLNVFVGTRQGQLMLVPEGQETQVIWPKGTKTLQCKEAPSGHLILPTSHWEKAGVTPPPTSTALLAKTSQSSSL